MTRRGSFPEAFAARLPDWMAQTGVPGLSLAVLEDGQIAWSGAFGVKSVATGEPVTADTVFEAASLSKPVFARAVLDLCEAGLLDMDAPLADRLPEPYLPDPRIRRITARHVLCHRTGLPNWRPRGQPPAFLSEPGERFGYSGEGYVYLQTVVERLTGRPMAAFMQEALLHPLAMRGSSYVWRDGYDGQAAQGHDRDGKPREKYRPAQGGTPPTPCTRRRRILPASSSPCWNR